MAKETGERWKEVVARVRDACQHANRDPKEVRIVAVSKTRTPEEVRGAWQSGAEIFAENYVQEMGAKIDYVVEEGRSPSWHFIGALQSKKAKKLVGKIDLLHSLDRWSLVEELEKQRVRHGAIFPSLLQVNIAKEKSKAGLSPEEVLSFARHVSEKTGLEICGLMVFPPYAENLELSRSFFRNAREIAKKLRDLHLPRIEARELSMGVTSDFEVAIEEGATLVRIGEAIFGPRQKKVSKTLQS